MTQPSYLPHNNRISANGGCEPRRGFAGGVGSSMNAVDLIPTRDTNGVCVHEANTLQFNVDRELWN